MVEILLIPSFSKLFSHYLLDCLLSFVFFLLCHPLAALKHHFILVLHPRGNALGIPPSAPVPPAKTSQERWQLLVNVFFSKAAKCQSQVWCDGMRLALPGWMTC